MSDRVIVSKQDGVADVRMNRPDKLNALDQAMFEGLVETGKALASDRSLRAVVLSGEGRAFCAGLDFASFMGMAQSERPARSLLDRGESVANFAQQAAARAGGSFRAVEGGARKVSHRGAFGGGWPEQSRPYNGAATWRWPQAEIPYCRLQATQV